MRLFGDDAVGFPQAEEAQELFGLMTGVDLPIGELGQIQRHNSGDEAPDIFWGECQYDGFLGGHRAGVL